MLCRYLPVDKGDLEGVQVGAVDVGAPLDGAARLVECGALQLSPTGPNFVKTLESRIARASR